MEKVRLDKWLWAARFYKTRNIAKQAIEGGKVQVEKTKSKVSKEIVPGMEIILTKGWDKITVIVEELSDKRGPAPDAKKLYKETQESIDRRLSNAQDRKLAAGSVPRTRSKPSGKDRRSLQKLKEELQGNTP